MLGLGDFWVSLVFILMLGSVALCVVYGIVNWNKDGEPSKKEIAGEKPETDPLAPYIPSDNTPSFFMIFRP